MARVSFPLNTLRVEGGSPVLFAPEELPWRPPILTGEPRGLRSSWDGFSPPAPACKMGDRSPAGLPMLNLYAPTDPRWCTAALLELDAVLLDHAHCEKKAASTALSLLFRYPDHEGLVLPLTRLAREELAHFEQVLGHLHRRGQRFVRQVPSAYAGRLLAAVRPREPDRLLDTLLCFSLIEARSCERMQLLAEAVPDEELVTLYRGLLASEARHHGLFVDLARQVRSEDEVRSRLGELARHEWSVLQGAGGLPRMHG